MKVTTLIASPLKNGNGELMVNEIIKGIKENNDIKITNYYLEDLNIEPCHSCGHCGDGIDCKIKDDGSEIIDNLLNTDLLIFSSPIYFGQMSAQGKTFIDRWYSIFTNPQKEFKGKAILVFASMQSEGFYNPYIELTKTNTFQFMGWDVINTLSAGEVIMPGDVNNQVEKLKEAYEAGKAL
jgi:multimeric flavodoxin WrbA